MSVFHDTPLTEELLYQHLESLGSTGMEVAEMFRVLGIRGSPEEAYDCLVAHYIGQHPQVSSCFVFEDVIEVCLNDVEEDQMFFVIKPPGGIKEVIELFDNLQLRDLEKQVELVDELQLIEV